MLTLMLAAAIAASPKPSPSPVPANPCNPAESCRYVGQETTSRMKRRSAVKTRMVPLRFEGPSPAFGTPVETQDGLRAGEVLTGREGRALALLRLDRAVSGPLTCEGRAVVLDVPPWWPPGTL